MRAWVLLLAMVMTMATATSVRADEPAAIRGTVVDTETGLGIDGALVTAGERTAESAADGSFELAASGTAAVVAFVYAEGYAPAEHRLTAAGPNRVALRRDAGAVEIIEVTGKPPDTASPTSYTLGRDQIRALPGSANDVLRALQSLPGVNRISFGLGGIVLRGTSPHESSVFIDGIEVPLAFHFAGLTTVYPSPLLDTVVLTPGGGDAVFGRGVGGVVELRGRAARTDRVRIGGEVGVFDASAYAEVPVAGGGVAIGLRRSYADAFINQLLPPDRQHLPRYYDGQLRYDRPLAGGTLTVLGFFSDDELLSWGGTEVRQGFGRTAVRWQRAIGRTSLSLMPWAGVGRTELIYVLEHTEDRPDLPQKLRIERHPVGLRADLRRDAGWGHVAAGVDVQGFYARGEMPRIEIDLEDLDVGGEEVASYAGTALDVGAWVEARWRIDDGKLTLKPGLRVDRYGVFDAIVIEPRIVVTHELTPRFTLRETFGVHHQPPPPMFAIAADDRDKPGALLEATHTSVGARVELPADVIGAVTAYHLALRGPPPRRTGNLSLEELNPEAFIESLPAGIGIIAENLIGEEFGGIRSDRRRGAGVEVSLQRRTDRWLTWLSYTLARSQRHEGGPTREGWITQPIDQTHNLNLVGSVRLGGWQLGARLRYTTGFPYTPRLTATIDADGRDHVTYGPENSARMGPFVALDARIDRTWHRSWGSLGCFIDVQNVTNRDNPEAVGYDRGSTVPRPLKGLPILPLVGVSYTPPD